MIISGENRVISRFFTMGKEGKNRSGRSLENGYDTEVANKGAILYNANVENGNGELTCQKK